MNKRHWNQINLFGYLSEELICSLIRHSYSLVVQKLPKALRISLKGVTEVEGTVLAE